MRASGPIAADLDGGESGVGGGFCARLFDSKTQARGYFKKAAIEHLIKRDQRQSGYSKEIFCVLTLELWHRVILGNGFDSRKNAISVEAAVG